MTDLRGNGNDEALDQLIDKVAAQRGAGTNSTEFHLVPPFSDYELLSALAKFSTVEWPADEAEEKIAAQLALPRGRLRRRPVVVGAKLIGAAAAAVLLVTGAVQLTSGTHGKTLPVAARSTPIARSTSPAHSVGSPDVVSAMSIVSKPRALRAISVLGASNESLLCATRRICYVQGYRSPKHAEFARSLDGGATWHQGAALPAFPVNDPWDAQLSCPSPMTCYSGYPTGLLVTTDGFAHFRVLAVPGPGSQIVQVACPTTQNCIAAVWHHNGRETFIYTTDGWSTWSTARAPVLPIADLIGELKCDRDGACIALLLDGAQQDALVSALSSTDGGRSWSGPARFASIGVEEEWRFDCGDGRHCVVIGNNGTSIAWVSISRAGQIAIRVQRWPKSFPPGADDVSCPSGRYCFIEVTNLVGAAYTDNLLEVTHDGGRTWSNPIATPVASVSLSCPVKAGCVAVGPTSQDSVAVLSNLRRPAH